MDSRLESWPGFLTGGRRVGQGTGQKKSLTLLPSLSSTRSAVSLECSISLPPIAIHVALQRLNLETQSVIFYLQLQNVVLALLPRLAHVSSSIADSLCHRVWFPRIQPLYLSLARSIRTDLGERFQRPRFSEPRYILHYEPEAPSSGARRRQGLNGRRLRLAEPASIPRHVRLRGRRARR